MCGRKSSKPEVKTAEQRPPCDGRVSRQDYEKRRPTTAMSTATRSGRDAGKSDDDDSEGDEEDIDDEMVDDTESDLR